MVSILYNFVYWFKRPFASFILPPARDSRCPTIKHRVLEEDYISKFKEIFIIGDVHGCKTELDELLEIAGAKNDAVLKIFAGDLINKGPYNLEVLNYIRSNTESILAVRGNHEEVVLRNYFDNDEETNKTNPDTSWIQSLSEDDINFLVELPYTISIPSLNVIIVHAGLIPGLPLSHHKTTDMVSMRNLVITNEYFGAEGIKALKDETDGEAWATVWPGPEHIFFGHDAKRKLQLEQFATGLDTGCLYGGSLTGAFISGPRDGAFVHVKAKKRYREIKKSKVKSKS